MRAVVAEDRLVVAVDEEVARAGGDQRGRRRRGRERPVAETLDAALLPLGERPLEGHRPLGAAALFAARELGEGGAGRLRHEDLPPPRQAVNPAVLLEEVRDRRENVRRRRPDITPAVAV